MKSCYNHIPLKKRIFVQKYKCYIKKCYCLSMVPYPSGLVHLGHIRNYTIGDSVTSFYQINHNVNILQPMGWDSFGLPAENAAYYNKKKPHVWVYRNIKQMKAQFKLMCYSYNWHKELITSDIKYYKHEQLLFSLLYSGYYLQLKKSFVNWDPKDKTILSNEQIINGKGWRSNVRVQKKKKRQWFFITKSYANILLSDLSKLKNFWLPKVLLMQQNWINQKIVILISISNIFTFLISFSLFIKSMLHTGFQYIFLLFKKILFFKKKYFFCLFNSIKYNNIFFNNNIYLLHNVYLPYFIIESKYKIKIQYNINNWSISRQRYWGCPIPINYCKKCGLQLNIQIPIKLPISLQDRIKIKKFYSFYLQKCNNCLFFLKKEIDTLDTFVESSWYYLRYGQINSVKRIVDIDKIHYWNPVNKYVGGIEHAILHLLYSRFISKLLKILNLIYIALEPFDNLLTQGMVLLKGTKMSKSKDNVIQPKQIISNYSINSLKLFILFMAPIHRCFNWVIDGINGLNRFINKILKIIFNYNIYTKQISIHTLVFLLLSKNIKCLNNFVCKSIELNLQFEFLFFNIVISNIMKGTKFFREITLDKFLVKYIYFTIKFMLNRLLKNGTLKNINFLLNNIFFLFNQFTKSKKNLYVLIKSKKNNKNFLSIFLKKFNKMINKNLQKIFRLSSLLSKLFFEKFQIFKSNLLII